MSFPHPALRSLQNIPAKLPMVFGDPNQLQQVFLNLITNARQAMEEQKKGRLVIEGESSDGKIRLCLLKMTVLESRRKS